MFGQKVGRRFQVSIEYVAKLLHFSFYITGFKLRLRWIPSELNPGDPPSRARALAEFSIQQGVRDLIANVAEKGSSRQSWRGNAPEFHSRFLAQSHAKQEIQIETRKRKRAEGRTALYGSHPGVEETRQESFLEQKSVSTARQQSYAKSWEGFTQWAKMNRLKVKTSLDIDKAAAERMIFLFFDGHDLADVHTLMAAIKFFRQDITLGGTAEGNSSSGSVHKTRASSRTCPHSFSSVCFDSPTNLEFSQADRVVVGDDMGYLCPARGSTPSDVSGCGAAKPNDSLLCGDPQLRCEAGEPKQGQSELGRAGSETPLSNFEVGEFGRSCAAGPAVPLRSRRTLALPGQEGKGQRPLVYPDCKAME